MKPLKTLFPAVILLLLSGCTDKAQKAVTRMYLITAKVNNLTDGKVYLNLMKLDSFRRPYWPVIDSAVVRNGAFEMAGDSILTEPAWASGLFHIDSMTGKKTWLTFYNDQTSLSGQKSGNFILENSHILISGDIDDPKGLSITGSPETAFNFRWGLYDPPINQLAPVNAAIDSLNYVFDTLGMDALLAQKRQILDSYYQRFRKVVEGNPQRFGSLSLIKQNSSYLTATQVESLLGLLDPGLLDLPSATAVRQYLSHQKSFEVNGQFPDLEYTDSSGTVQRLFKLKGKTRTLVIFWASWCMPCREEIPSLKKLKAKIADSGVQLISITIDREKIRWLQALRKEKMDWPNLSGFELSNGDVADNNNITYVPKMFLLDENMKVLSNSLRSVEAVENTLLTSGVLKK